MSVSSSLARLNGVFAIRKPTGITSAKVVNKLKAALLQDIQETKRLANNGLALHADGSASVTEENAGATSFCVKKYRRGFKLPKIGHGGTLDMNATGVLVIGIGSGTKHLSTYLRGGKKYIAQGILGRATDTMDAGGQDVETSEFGHITHSGFNRVLEEFVGDILQVPPVYSALKVKGERMSDLVKKGTEVEPKPARPVMVYSLHCSHFNPPHFEFEISCGGGFYVRKLIHDIGIRLGSCAHMTSLCRTQQGCFTLEQHALPQEKWTLQDVIRALVETKDSTAVR